MNTKPVVFSIFMISFLDALSTYILVASGRGVEANPIIADIVNAEPVYVFIINIIVAAAVAASITAADMVIRQMPAAVGAKMRRVMYIAFGVSTSWRAAVVINNALGITAGVTPLADLFFNT